VIQHRDCARAYGAIAVRKNAELAVPVQQGGRAGVARGNALVPSVRPSSWPK
jgi:hypothetical protein